MRAPTKQERTKEATVLYSSTADLWLLCVMITVALGTRSLTLFSEMIRSSLMLVIEVYGIYMLRAVHRERLQKFSFGTGKVEHTCHLAIGSLLVGSAFWIANHAVNTLLSAQDAATPLGLTMAAVFNALVVFINFLAWKAVLAASRGEDDSLIFQGLLRSRNTRFLSSAIVQVTLTGAALARDPAAAILFDVVGAALVAGFMLSRGVKMLKGCLPNLLDHPLPASTKQVIENGLRSAGLAPEEVVRMRTRRAGRFPYVELTLAPAACGSLADYSRRAAHVEICLKKQLRGANVSVVLDTHDS